MEPGSAPGPGKHIVLVVDDDAPIREALAYDLRAAGYEPVTAKDGLEAWEILQAGPDRFAAVLLDRTMPRMDGMEVLTRVREHEALRGLPVIFQTARAAREDVVEGLQAGAHYYLTKPFDRAALLAIVRAAVTDRAQYLELRDRTRRAEASFRLLVRGTYTFRTIDEARALAALLAGCSAEPDKVVLGLSELMTNAVEHGNLGITYEEKTRLLAQEAWHAEVARRLELPAYRERKATVEFERGEAELRFRIRDQGSGFRWGDYVEFRPERAFDSHGRGIAISLQVSFDRLDYVEPGNEVIAVRREPAGAPAGADPEP
jgi:DNA-binding response OmpR family regulator